MQLCSFALLFVLGAWFADEPAAPQKPDAVRAAAEAHARAKMQADVNRATAIKVVRQFDAAFNQAKTYLEPFRERLDLEINYVERTCGLTDDEATALRRRGTQTANRAQTELAMALAAQAGQGPVQPRQAVVIVNGNAVAVPAGVSAEYLTDPVQAARKELLRVAADMLPAEARAKIDKADEQRHERALKATRLAVLAVLDDALLLSAPQREEIGRLLETSWTVPVAPGRNAMLAGPAHAAEMLYSARLVLPKAKVATALRPAQQSAIKSLSEPQSQAAGAGPRVVRMGRPAAVRLNAVRGGLAGGLVREGNLMRIEVQGRAGQQLSAVFQPLTAAERSATYLELMVDEVTAACELADEQRAKLLLAGRLDLKRVTPVPTDDAANGVGVNNAAGMIGHVQMVERKNAAGVIQADVVRLDAGSRQEEVFADHTSAYQKVLRGKLSDEQLRRLSEARCERLAMHQRAVVAAVLQAIDERLLLSGQQHQRLTDFFEVPIANDRQIGSTGSPRDQVVARLARISARDLEPMFDEFQRPLVARYWQELWATVPLATGPVLEIREAR